MADISKIKLANGTTVTLKDAQGRADMTTILGGHALAALGAAAWQAMAASISDAGIADAATVKAYVDSQVGKIHNFDVVIDADGTAATGPSVAASAAGKHAASTRAISFRSLRSAVLILIFNPSKFEKYI